MSIGSIGQVKGSNYIVDSEPDFTVPSGETWQCLLTVNATFNHDSTDTGYFRVRPFVQIDGRERPPRAFIDGQAPCVPEFMVTSSNVRNLLSPRDFQ